MKETSGVKKRFFDDRIFLCVRTNDVWIGRPDFKIRGKPWTWWFKTSYQSLKRDGGPPENFVEIAREPEMSLCGRQS